MMSINEMQSISQKDVSDSNRGHESVMTAVPVTKKDQFNNELDDLFNKMAIEHAVVETDFQHVFSEQKVERTLENSPYQMMYNEQDTLGVGNEAYTFLNGSTQGEYDILCLKTMELPGINKRF